jgi:hypothetical protein
MREMALSEYESQRLADIERALSAQAPVLAARLKRGPLWMSRVNGASWGAPLFVLGLAALVGGVASKALLLHGFPIVSVIGYPFMIAGASYLLPRWVA